MWKKDTDDSLIYGEKRQNTEENLVNELLHLAQCKHFGVKGTYDIDFIPKSEIAQGWDIKCANYVCKYRPLQYELYRTILFVGGKKLIYEEDYVSPTDSRLEIKILINSVISNAKKGARFCSYDIKDFFLVSPKDRP